VIIAQLESRVQQLESDSSHAMIGGSLGEAEHIRRLEEQIAQLRVQLSEKAQRSIDASILDDRAQDVDVVVRAFEEKLSSKYESTRLLFIKKLSLCLVAL
jgi:hypothetical protein